MRVGSSPNCARTHAQSGVPSGARGTPPASAPAGAGCSAQPSAGAPTTAAAPTTAVPRARKSRRFTAHPPTRSGRVRKFLFPIAAEEIVTKRRPSLAVGGRRGKLVEDTAALGGEEVHPHVGRELAAEACRGGDDLVEAGRRVARLRAAAMGAHRLGDRLPVGGVK